MRCYSAYSTISATRKTIAASVVSASLIVLSGCSDSDDDADTIDADGNAVSTDGPAETVSIDDPVEEVDFMPVADPNDNVPPPTDESIADSLLVRSDYGQLLNFIEIADLTEALQGDNSGLGWTLFAPSDRAFEDADFPIVTDEQINFVARNHLFSGMLMFEELNPGLLTMVEGSVEIEENEDGTITVGGATVVARDRVVGNGIIHFVDAVLEPFE